MNFTDGIVNSTLHRLSLIVPSSSTRPDKRYGMHDGYYPVGRPQPPRVYLRGTEGPYVSILRATSAFNVDMGDEPMPYMKYWAEVSWRPVEEWKP